jgi:hypothetical protein
MNGRHATEVWDRGFKIDSLEAACRFVESVWNDERVPPVRLHNRGPQPRDLSGSPRWSGAFNRYIFASPSDVDTIVSKDRGVVDERHFYRYPLWRALSILTRRDHDTWTKGVPRRPFHPSPVAVLCAMAVYDFDSTRVTMRYSDMSVIPRDMLELFAIGAARKLRGTYQEEYVEWVAKSDAQQAAEQDPEAA